MILIQKVTPNWCLVIFLVELWAVEVQHKGMSLNHSDSQMLSGSFDQFKLALLLPNMSRSYRAINVLSFWALLLGGGGAGKPPILQKLILKILLVLSWLILSPNGRSCGNNCGKGAGCGAWKTGLPHESKSLTEEYKSIMEEEHHLDGMELMAALWLHPLALAWLGWT